MLAALFRSNQPAVLLAVPLLAVALFGPAFLVPAPPTDGLMPLADLVDGLLGMAAWPRHLVGLLLVMVVAVQLTGLVNGLELMERRNHLPALVFILFMAAFSGKTLYGPALLGMPFIPFALRRTWSIGNTGGALAPLFDAGLLIGIAALFYLPYVFVLVTLWASVSLIRPFHWREYVVPAVGVATAFFLAWSVLYLSGATPWRPLHTVITSTADGMTPPGGVARTTLYIVAGLLLLVSLAAFSNSYSRSVMRGKNLRSSFLAFTMSLGVGCGSVWVLCGSFPAVLATTPLATLAGYALLTPRRPWLAEVTCLLLLGTGLWVHWVG